LISKAMLLLAKNSGYTSVSELYANEVTMLLNEFMDSKSFLTWNKLSKDRLKFDAIIRNC